MTDFVMLTPERPPSSAHEVSMESMIYGSADFISQTPKWTPLIISLTGTTLDETAVGNQFDVSESSGDITVAAGEAIIGNSVVVRDTETTYSVSSGTSYSTQPLYIGWYTQSANQNGEVRVGVESDFQGGWFKTEIAQVSATDGTLTLEADTRPLGKEGARFRLGSQSDIQLKRVDSRPSNADPSDNTWYVVGPERHVERPTPDGFYERVSWTSIGTTIEDFEDSGGSFPAYWEPYSGHAITSSADLQGGSWGFSTEGRNGTTTAPALGLPARPEPGEWFEFLFRVDTDISQTYNCYIRFGLQPNNDGKYEFYLEFNPDSDDIMRLDAIGESGTNQGGLIPYDTVFPGGYTPGTIYRVQVYWGEAGEEWVVRWFDHATDTIILDETGTTSVNHGAGGIEIRCLNYTFDFSLDRFRRPPLDPPTQ